MAAWQEQPDNLELLQGIQSIKAEVTAHFESREYGKAIRLIMAQADKGQPVHQRQRSRGL
jgi:hypothetical protein